MEEEKAEEIKKEIEEEQLLEPLATTEQMCFIYLAKSVETFFVDSYYFKLQAILTLMKDPNINGEEILIKEYGKEKAEELMKKLEQFDKIIGLLKIFYDGCSPKSIIKLDMTDNRFLMMQSLIGNMPLIPLFLNEIFYTLFDKTTLRNKTISNTMLANERRIYRVFSFIEEEKIRDQIQKEQHPELEGQQEE